eukprot:CAMPEP_0201284638 /NCGR_PEP_ID=MMETSP1317-20130820/80266_1 /ASSEMBLY_ACC=CAM_ASM_000770 /TAXON_ID=187299 /ORGANISM="Undescribed Undescribed, Strain Undescribed" /LENGTH=114 /DNA_ID=CAMNT_0047605613 /DNA_START=121 /DNA_END=462 /DNA_ORIENTATION=+
MCNRQVPLLDGLLHHAVLVQAVDSRNTDAKWAVNSTATPTDITKDTAGIALSLISAKPKLPYTSNTTPQMTAHTTNASQGFMRNTVTLRYTASRAHPMDSQSLSRSPMYWSQYV